MTVLNIKDIQGHDSFVRKVMTNKDLTVAKEFFAQYLPAEILKLADLNTLKLENDNLQDNELDKGRVDILYSAQFDNEIGYFQILLEHQTRSDYWMSFRIMKYMLKICAEHRKKYPKDKHLPLIYPIILFSGKGKYTAPRDFWSLFKHPQLAKQFYSDEYKVLSLRDIPDEQIKQMHYSGVMQYLLKHIHDKDIIPAIREIMPLLSELAKLDEGFYIQAALLYTLQKGESSTPRDIVKLFKEAVKEEQKEDVMTIADALRMEGKIEGIQLGKEEGIQVGEARGIQLGEARGIQLGEARGIQLGEVKGQMREKTKFAQTMLAKGFDIALIAEITTLTPEQVETIKLKGTLLN